MQLIEERCNWCGSSPVFSIEHYMPGVPGVLRACPACARGEAWRDPPTYRPRAAFLSGQRIRCIAPARRPRYNGEQCGAFVTRVPVGAQAHLVGLVGHSDLATADSRVYACTICGMLHEVREAANPAELSAAA